MYLTCRSIGWNYSSTCMTSSLPQSVHIRSSGLLTSLQGSLNGWACGENMERQWVWSSRSAIFLPGTLTQRMGDI